MVDCYGDPAVGVAFGLSPSAAAVLAAVSTMRHTIRGPDFGPDLSMSDTRQVTLRDHRRVLPKGRTPVIALACLMGALAAAYYGEG